MIKTTITEDCDTVPKKAFVRDFNVAFAKGDTQYILDCLTDTIQWNMVGYKMLKGKPAVAKMLAGTTGQVSEVIIDNILEDAGRCSANGVMKFTNGSEVAFCDIYAFIGDDTALKVQTLTTYAIDL